MCYVVYNFFFFNDTATTEIYTLSLHDALPICPNESGEECPGCIQWRRGRQGYQAERAFRSRKVPAGLHETRRSEEHTSELQSRLHLVCRLLLEKKKKKHQTTNDYTT